MTQIKLLTKEGLQILKKELQILKSKQEHLVTQIEEVAQPDESGEDGLAQQLKEELEVVLEKIAKLDTAINNSRLISKNGPQTDNIQIGSRVKIRLSGKTEKEFQIVDELEANPAKNKISHQSPLGLALLGKKVKEEIEVDAPVGKITYKIISIK